MKTKIIVLATVLILVFFTSPLKAETFTIQQEIEEMLVCQDDCGMLVSGCDNPTARYMRGIIKEQIALGKSQEEILQHFVSIYGEQVLAAPPPKGFNLTAWVTPFLAILAGIVLMYFALDKWVFQSKMAQFDAENKERSIDIVEYEQQLEEELKKYW